MSENVLQGNFYDRQVSDAADVNTPPYAKVLEDENASPSARALKRAAVRCRTSCMADVNVSLQNVPDDAQTLDNIHKFLRSEAARYESAADESARSKASLISAVHDCFTGSDHESKSYQSCTHIHPNDIDVDVLSGISAAMPDVRMDVSVSKHGSCDIVCEDRTDHRYYNHIDMSFENGQAVHQSICHYDNIFGSCKDDESQIDISDMNCKTMTDFMNMADAACRHAKIERAGIFVDHTAEHEAEHEAELAADDMSC